jgi:hypothetical protein
MGIHPTFEYRSMNQEQIEATNHLRELSSNLLNAIEFHIPPGRYRSMAITKLEEAMLIANKGIAHAESAK